MKQKLIIIGVIVLLILSYGTYSGIVNRIEAKRAQQLADRNIKSLTQAPNTLRLKNGTLLAKQQQLEVSLSVAKASNDSLEKQCKDYGIKIKNLKSYSTASIESSHSLITALKDSLLSIKAKTAQGKDTVLQVKAKRFDYLDKWYEIHGTIVNNSDSVKVKAKCYHTFSVLDEFKYKGWFIFKRKVGIVTTFAVENPSDTIRVKHLVNLTK